MSLPAHIPGSQVAREEIGVEGRGREDAVFRRRAVTSGSLETGRPGGRTTWDEEGVNSPSRPSQEEGRRTPARIGFLRWHSGTGTRRRRGGLRAAGSWSASPGPEPGHPEASLVLNQSPPFPGLLCKRVTSQPPSSQDLMDRRGTKRRGENIEEAEPRNKLPGPAPSMPTDPALYSGPFPFYRRPSELGCFSLDAQRQYHGDAQALRYYSPPPTNGQGPNFDLRDGYPDRYQPRDEEIREGLDHLLRWLLDHRGQLEGGPGWLAGAIVTWRGHLTKLLTTPYERQEGWQLAASRFQGTLYLSEVETPAARAQRLARPPLLRELMYMGYKFEQYMCADKPGSSPDPSGEVNTNVAFCSVLRSRLGNHPLLFSGEVDCIDPQAPSTQPPTCYVELKTSKEMHSPGQWRSFYRHKLLKWWAQSFLLGIPNVIAGFRNPEGFICSLKTFPTMEMFEYVRNDRDGWNPSVCMNFCAAFLSFAQNTVVQDDPRLVYLFSWEPGSPVTVSKHQDAPYAFLPTWYVEAVTQDLPSPPKTLSPKN